MTEVIKMDDHTYRIEDGFVRYFLLEGTEKAVLIDSGVSRPDAKMIVQKYTSLPIILLNTHGDGDHMAGTGMFDKIYMGEDDYVNCMVKEKFPNTKLVPIKDGQTIDLGGRTLSLIAVPGHTYGSFAILDVERRMLYAGDTVQDQSIFMFGKHRSVNDFARSLKKLIDMSDRFDQVVASHGAAILPNDYIEKVLESWNMVINGQIDYSEMDLHGAIVKAFKTEYCGFYC